MQYKIRLSKESDMTWLEFRSLLSGIMPKTPLGQIVSVRAEEDKDVLKNFSKDQNKIRNEWRNKNNPLDYMTEEEKAEKAIEAQELFKQVFSGI
ncbi:Gp15 family bacteriophage protein [Clostridium botulinum]|uniref:Gp15 family bacteriophage protein n=1 Tax=Clostridium botulinum TaxID=1491 RepID=UPI001FAFE37C|nr:Gp15 family bacteriophage protein [Clostridium botulinum]